MSYRTILSELWLQYYPLVTTFGAAFAIVGSNFPEVGLIPRYKKMTSYVEKDGSEKKIKPELQDIIDRVLDRVALRITEEAVVDFYITPLSDPVHYGSTKTRSGVIIGLPVSLQYNKDFDLTKESFSFSGIRLVFDGTSNSIAAKNLAEAFTISSKAKAFLIASQLYYASSYRLHVDLVMKTCTVIGIVVSWLKFERRHALKLWAKAGVFSVFCLFWGAMYVFSKDAHRCWLDYAIDKKTARLGKDYAEGGVEYYESVIKRNKALRVLIHNGRGHFTPFGNDITMFRQKSLQKSVRRDNLVKFLKEYDNEEQNDMHAFLSPAVDMKFDDKVQ